MVCCSCLFHQKLDLYSNIGALNFELAGWEHKVGIWSCCRHIALQTHMYFKTWRKRENILQRYDGYGTQPQPTESNLLGEVFGNELHLACFPVRKVGMWFTLVNFDNSTNRLTQPVYCRRRRDPCSQHASPCKFNLIARFPPTTFIELRELGGLICIQSRFAWKGKGLRVWAHLQSLPICNKSEIVVDVVDGIKPFRSGFRRLARLAMKWDWSPRPIW